MSLPVRKTYPSVLHFNVRQLQKFALILAITLLGGCGGGGEVAPVQSKSSAAGKNLASTPDPALASSPDTAASAPVWSAPLGTPDPAPTPTSTPAPTPTPTSTSVQAVDTNDRKAVKDLYDNVIVPAFAVTPEWTGNKSGCQAGDTSMEWKAAVVRTVNSYRVLAGLPGAVTLNMANSALAQQAALMMEANSRLDHGPPTSWACYSTGGATAAGKSNLALWVIGPQAMRFYMSDRGVSGLGHRRWILYSGLGEVGTGDTAQANALWILGPAASVPASVGVMGVAWPPRGYVPWTTKVANPLDDWSFSLPGADFSAAGVTMTNDQGVFLTVSNTGSRGNGNGDNTIGWTLVSPESLWSRSPADTRLHVQVNNVLVDGQFRNFAYDVIFFLPW